MPPFGTDLLPQLATALSMSRLNEIADLLPFAGRAPFNYSSLRWKQCLLNL